MTKLKNINSHSFIEYFKRATSTLVILKLLGERPMYGYEIIQEMKKRSKGQYTLSIPYPALYRLIERGFIEESNVEIYNGRARTYYSITDTGGRYIDKTMCEYRELESVFESLIQRKLNV